MKLKLNLLLLYGAELTSKLCGVLIFGYLVTQLKSEAYGELEFAIAVYMVLSFTLDAGLSRYSAREAAREPARAQALAGQVILLRAMVLVVVLLALLAVAWISKTTLVLCYAIVLMPGGLMLNWAFQARDEMPVVAASSLLRQLILAAGVFLWVHEPADAVWVPVSDALGLGAVMLIQHGLFFKRQGAIRFTGAMRDARKVLQEALPIAGSALVWALRFYAPMLVLHASAGAESTAVLGGSYRPVGGAYAFVGLYFFNLLPTLSRLAVDPDRSYYRRFIGASLRLVSWVALAAATLSMALAEPIIAVLYRGALPAATLPLSVMLWSLVFAFWSGHARFTLLAHNLQGVEFRTALAGCVFSIGLSLALHAQLTPMLAAGIFVFAEAVTCLFAHAACARRLQPLPVLRTAGPPTLLAIGVLLAQRYWALPWSWSAATAVLAFALVAALFGRSLASAFVQLQVVSASPRSPPESSPASPPRPDA